MFRFPVLSLSIFSIFLGSNARAQSQFYVDQPANKLSTLVSAQGDAIQDWEFANMCKNLLIKNGVSNARGAIFLFEQCYSGGMLDDLETTLGSTVRWVGGSACRHDELSWGQKNSAPFPLDYWVIGLDQALDIPPPVASGRMIDYVNFARALDPVGPNGTGKEEPQSIYRNGGQNIRHKEPIPQLDGGHNAILWAGKADAKRHVNDIRILYYRLLDEFQATGDPFSIIVLGNSSDLGIPALPATKANLQAAFNSLDSLQGPNDDFLFFASNHGGCDTLVLDFNFPQIIGSGNNLSQRFSMSLGEMEGIKRTPDCEPGLRLEFSQLVGRGLRVFVDGIELGDPFDNRDILGNSFLHIDRAILNQIGPDIDVVLQNQTGDRVLLNKVLFRTGAINNAESDEPMPAAQIVNQQVFHAAWTGPGPLQWNGLDNRVQIASESGSPQTLGIDNLTNTRTGIVGVAMDIKYLGSGLLSDSDFVFQMSPTGAFDASGHPPANWQPAPLPDSIQVTDDGLQGSNRILLRWPNQSVSNRWLRITVKSNTTTGLAEEKVYYVGHLLGEQTGHAQGVYTVAFADIASIRASVGQSVDAGSILDIDKNSTISFSDISSMRANVGAQLTNITIP